MSIKAVFSGYTRINQHIEETEFRVAYNKTFERLNTAKELYRKWLDLYREYANGYSQELLVLASVPVIRMLSFNGVVLEDSFFKIYDSKIPSEAYLLIDDMFSNFGHDYVSYVLVQGDAFAESSIHNEVEKATRRLSSPGSKETRSTIDIIKREIRNRDTLLIYYERSQYDNPLSWPLLLHEGFHHIYHDEQLNTLEKKCPDVPWIQEALIDMYMTHFFGPVYTASTANYLMRFPHLASFSHPHFIARLYSSLLYLTGLMDCKELPVRISTAVSETFNYVNLVWNQYRKQETEVQEEVGKIYNTVETDLADLISRKTQSFLDLLLNVEKDRLEVFDKSIEEDYIENEIFNIEDVLDFYEKKIPIAANPRILFNSFISSRFLVEGVSRNFVTESLKKWYMRKVWFEIGPKVM